MRLTASTFGLIIPILVNAGSGFDADCPPNEWVKEGCEVNPNLCQIQCPANDGLCTITPEPQPGEKIACSVADLLPMTAEKCGEKCAESWGIEDLDQDPEDICGYWRYEVLGDGVKRCTFLRTSECGAHEECTGGC